ncbi:MAG: hypothetical protein FRX49_10458 [Trebouxia sp. A1-2]|nr:MAG: hypothetical protein FRX49_10458 [Trebouxia sp. A1-2]
MRTNSLGVDVCILLWIWARLPRYELPSFGWRFHTFRIQSGDGMPAAPHAQDDPLFTATARRPWLVVRISHDSSVLPDGPGAVFTAAFRWGGRVMPSVPPCNGNIPMVNVTKIQHRAYVNVLIDLSQSLRSNDEQC